MQSAVVYSLNHDTYAHPQHMKVLNHFTHIQCGCGMQSVVAYSLNDDMHNNVILASPYPIFPKFSSHRQRYKSVMVHPYAHPQHMKLLNHFIYIHYGCEMQSAVAHSVNHDTTMSFRLNLTRMQSVVAYSLNHDTTAHLGSTLPQFSNIWPQSAQVV